MKELLPTMPNIRRDRHTVHRVRLRQPGARSPIHRTVTPWRLPVIRKVTNLGSHRKRVERFPVVAATCSAVVTFSKLIVFPFVIRFVAQRAYLLKFFLCNYQLIKLHRRLDRVPAEHPGCR